MEDFVRFFCPLIVEAIHDLEIDSIKYLIWFGLSFALLRIPYVQKLLGKYKTILENARRLHLVFDQVRYPGFSGCSCKDGSCYQFHCGQLHRMRVLSDAINAFVLHLPSVPHSNTLAQQYLANINKQAAELLLGIDKYANGIRSEDVLAINYIIDEQDAFQQRFKASIIGLEACLA